MGALRKLKRNQEKKAGKNFSQDLYKQHVEDIKELFFLTLEENIKMCNEAGDLITPQDALTATFKALQKHCDTEVTTYVKGSPQQRVFILAVRRANHEIREYLRTMKKKGQAQARLPEDNTPIVTVDEFANLKKEGIDNVL